MFYNVENLFDIYDDTLKDDNAFLPEGLMRWNQTRYQKKISSLYKTITAAGQWDPPAIVAMCEIENRKVLEDLVYNTYLSKYNYKIIHEDSPDERGIDVCMIFRKDYVKMINYCYWRPGQDTSDSDLTRNILYSGIIINDDTVHLIMTHWPSRRGGVMTGEGLRMRIAEMIRHKVDSISEKCHSPQKIIICGDFNCAPGDMEIKALTKLDSSKVKLINLSENFSNAGQGTYKYRGTWEMIDQVLVSEEILSRGKGIFTCADKLSIFNADFLLMKDPKFPGLMPFSTYRGFRYQGGFSDHLPVLLDLELRLNH